MSDTPPIIPAEQAKEIEVEVLPPEAPPRIASGDNGKGHGMEGKPSAVRFRVALALAMLVDAVQIGLFPLFAPGFVSVANIGVDTTAFLIFLVLIGWHPVLLPGFILEQVPLLGIAPTWTIAVWLASRRHLRTEEITPTPEPKP